MPWAITDRFLGRFKVKYGQEVQETHVKLELYELYLWRNVCSLLKVAQLQALKNQTTRRNTASRQIQLQSNWHGRHTRGENTTDRMHHHQGASPSASIDRHWRLFCHHWCPWLQRREFQFYLTNLPSKIYFQRLSIRDMSQRPNLL